MRKIEYLFQRFKYLPYFIFAVIIAALYGNVLIFGYVNDDFLLVNINSLSQIIHPPFPEHVRPVWYLSYFLTNLFFQSAAFDHIINFLLFLFSSFLAYNLAKIYLMNTFVAFISTTVWILFPWVAFPVCWISQRNDLLLFVFVFSSLLFLYNNNFTVSLVLLISAVLSKVTALFLPVFYLYKLFQNKKYIHLFVTASMFTAFFIVSIHSMLANQNAQIHLQGISAPLVVANHLKNWAESLFCFVFPMPFFISSLHLIFYSIGIALLGTSLVIRRKIFSSESMVDFSKILDLLFISFLLTIPTTISCELRIISLESFFVLLLIVAFILRRQVRNKAFFCLAMVIILASYIISIEKTKTRFASPYFDAKKPHYISGLYYPNNYYTIKREFLVHLLSRFR